VLERPHYDFAMMQYAVRNVANYSPAPLDPPPGQPHEWELLCRLAGALRGEPDADPNAEDERVAASMVGSMVRDPGSVIHGADPTRILAELAPRHGPERLLDLMLRAGPYGDGFGAGPGTLTLDELIAHPHGMDFGPLVPMLPDLLRTPDGMISLAPPELMAEVAELGSELGSAVSDGLLLIGRRHLRSNNSWMHNVPMLMTGGERCTLLMHPDDALARGLDDGDLAAVRSTAGEVLVPVETTQDIRVGVVSLPHGWGHLEPDIRQSVARAHAGVNSNLLTDPHRADALTGTAVLNAIPVEVSAAPRRAPDGSGKR
jgi:anaerobic selenocysteine-containing dehydrogenase